MAEINHFEYGALTPGIAYVMSCVGSALGLLCATRARVVRGSARARWVVLAAISIGGTGIWGMHFVGMLGFSVDGTSIRYDVARTVVSLVVAIVVVGIGLAVAGREGAGTGGLILGGMLAGVGVALMHYLGMSALSLQGDIEYDPFLVVLSFLIAMAAATAALWFALTVRGFAAIAGASSIMGLAISGMHYTGMSAMSVDARTGSAVTHGVEAAQFLAPLVTGVTLFTVITLFIVALSASTEEIREESELAARLDRLTDGRTANRGVPPGPV